MLLIIRCCFSGHYLYYRPYIVYSDDSCVKYIVQDEGRKLRYIHSEVTNVFTVQQPAEMYTVSFISWVQMLEAVRVQSSVAHYIANDT